MKPLCYLSIDIDFWPSPRYAEEPLRRLFDRFMSRVPVRAVMNHHQLLRHVDASPARVLVNLDWHSDFKGGVDCLSCGSWVSYVRWRGEGEYVWACPYKRVTSRTNGNCNYGGPWNAGSDWAWMRRRHCGVGTSLLDLCSPYRVAEVGLALSPTYSDKPVLALARELVREYSIPYTKGVVDEDGSPRSYRNVPPPMARDRSGKRIGHHEYNAARHCHCRTCLDITHFLMLSHEQNLKLGLHPPV